MRALAPVLLAVSVLARLAYTFGTPNGDHLVDLRVYSYGSAALGQDTLYAFTFGDLTPGFPLPFTYPPFAAMVLYPLHWMPFTVLAVVWQLGSIAALWGVVRLSLRLLFEGSADAPRWHRAALVWTAVGIWLEPVRTTLTFGQINVFIVLCVLVAVRARRWWWTGALIGVLAGVKLTPAITGVYLLAQRNIRATVFSAVVFAGTVLVSFVAVPAAAMTYFGGLGSDASRVGPVGSVINQSLRGTLSRFAGHDVGWGGIWLAAVCVVTALAVAAFARLGRDDRLGVLVAVQLLGLLVSPISWSHHWVWFVPALLWLVHGPLRGRATSLALAAAVLVLLSSRLIGALLLAQPSIWDFGRPLPLAIAGSAYPVAAVLVLGLMAWQPGRSGAPRARTSPPAQSELRPVAG